MKRIFIVAVLFVVASIYRGNAASCTKVVTDNHGIELWRGSSGGCYLLDKEPSTYNQLDTKRYEYYVCGSYTPRVSSGCDGCGYLDGVVVHNLNHGEHFDFNGKNYVCKNDKFIESGDAGTSSGSGDNNGNDNTNSTLKSYTDNGGRSLRTYDGSTLKQSYACGNYSECNIWGETYAALGYHTPSSCKKHGDRVDFGDKIWWCCISGETSSNYGAWKESSSWEITTIQTKDGCKVSTLTDVCGKFISSDVDCESGDVATTKSIANNTCDSDTQFLNQNTGECVDKSKYVAISTTDMQKCFACENNDDFKICTINKCYLENANAAKCTSKLKKSCLLSRN